MTRTGRALSSAVTYTTLVAVTFALTAGLVVGSEELVQNQREETALSQLEVVGERLADGLMSADRLARGTDVEPESVVITKRLPARVAGSGYTIEVQPGLDVDRLRLTADEFNATATVEFSVESDLDETSVKGGTLRVVYNTGASPPQLEVHHG